MANMKSVEEGRQRREAILTYIEQYVEENQYAPTIEGIAAGLDVSHQTVRHHLRILEKEGRVSVGRGPRMIRLMP